MIILPAIDLYDKKAVRLYQGDYKQMTVYSENPIEIARAFEEEGATHIHMVDLEGAKDGTTPNLHIVSQVVKETSLLVEIGGGIRSMDTIERYIQAGVDKVILGTIAATNEEFVAEAVKLYGDKIAVGADVKEGSIAIKGWMETSKLLLDEFLSKMVSIGVKYVICTDISKDGAMEGSNHKLYEELSNKYEIHITASGGVSSIDDIKRLRKLNIYGAIIGKAYYIGAISLKEAIEVGK